MMRIHFLNVGHGDCTVIEHEGGNITVVDINNGSELDPVSKAELKSSYGITALSETAALLYEHKNLAKLLVEKGYDIPLTNPIEYFETHFKGHSVFRYIQTHPDLDHMRGLSALRAHKIPILNFWDKPHDKEPDFQSDSDKAEWAEYIKLGSGKGGATVLDLYRGNTGIYYNENPKGVAGGDSIHIISPTKELVAASNQKEDTNNLSYVLWLKYKGIRVVLGADAESPAWETMHSYYGSNLSCEVLKASHHGRDSGYHQEAVKAMSPVYTVVSVGKKPDTDASNKYKQYSNNVWSTRWRGNITMTIRDEGKFLMESEYDR